MTDDYMCRTCRYLHRDERPEYELHGYCRRYPPIITEQVTFGGSGADYYSQRWPWMNPTDWCGEWKGIEHVEQ